MPAVLNHEVSAAVQHTPYASAGRIQVAILSPPSPLVENAGTSEARGGLGVASEMNELILGVRLAAAPAT